MQRYGIGLSGSTGARSIVTYEACADLTHSGETACVIALSHVKGVDDASSAPWFVPLSPCRFQCFQFDASGHLSGDARRHGYPDIELRPTTGAR